MTDTLSLIQATWIGRVIEITSLVLILISDVDTFELRHGEVWSLLTLMSSLTIKFGTRLMLWRKEWFEPQTWRGVMSFAMPPLLMSMSGCLTSSSTTWWCRRWEEWCQRRGKEFGFPTDFSCTTSYGTILMLIKNVGYKPVGTHLVTFSYILLHFKCNLKFLQTCWCRIAIALIRPVLSSLNCRDVMFCL